MSNTDRSDKTRMMYLIGRELSNYNRINRNKQIEGPRNVITPSSTLTIMKIAEEPLIVNNMIITPVCCPLVPSTIPTICPSIDLEDIATLIDGDWVLNNDTTILECQTLTIPGETIFHIPENLTLTINGSVVNNGTIANDGITNINGTFTNNGTINNNTNGTINIYGTLNNTGTINNTGIINVYVSGSGVLNNSGTISGSGTINYL